MNHPPRLIATFAAASAIAAASVAITTSTGCGAADASAAVIAKADSPESAFKVWKRAYKKGQWETHFALFTEPSMRRFVEGFLEGLELDSKNDDHDQFLEVLRAHGLTQPGNDHEPNYRSIRNYYGQASLMHDIIKLIEKQGPQAKLFVKASLPEPVKIENVNIRASGDRAQALITFSMLVGVDHNQKPEFEEFSQIVPIVLEEDGAWRFDLSGSSDL